MLTTVDQNVPKLKLRGISRPPWIDKDVGLRLVRKKKAMWKSLKSNTSLKLTSKFKPLRKQTKHEPYLFQVFSILKVSVG